MRSHRGSEGSESGGESESRGTPGKRTLTQAIQRRADGAASGDVHAAAEHGISGTTERLPFLDQIQASFGAHDVGAVQAHTDGNAAEGAHAMGAEAFATGNDVAFAGAPDLHTAAHEAAHVVQQRGGVQLSGGVGETGDAYEQHADQVADAVVRGESAEGLLGGMGGGGGGVQRLAVQRYEAGEHAKSGDTEKHIKKAFAPFEYTVVKGDTPDSIAAKFAISVDDLKAANKDLLKKDKKGVESFDVGVKLSVPKLLNEMQKDAAADPSIEVTVNGVKLDYGHLVAMGGDLFGSVDELMKATPDELKEIAKLIDEEKTTGKAVDSARWQKATKGRFVKLAADNESHFAPTNTDFAPDSKESKGDHKSSWKSHHKKAIEAARAGEKDKALTINGFGDHFLTDAFAAGHLFNKADVMDKFDDQLPHVGSGTDEKFKDTAFFDAVAKAAFVGAVATEFSKYETGKPYAMGWRPNIDSASRFSSLLQGIHMKKPELLNSAVAKGVHDKLNTLPGGLPVENLQPKSWSLSGDNTMNADTLAVAQEAVAVSQQQVMGQFKSTAAIDHDKLAEEVWNFTPRPTAASKKTIKGAVDDGTDIKGGTLQSAIVGLINANYMLIISELVALGELRKA